MLVRRVSGRWTRRVLCNRRLITSSFVTRHRNGGVHAAWWPAIASRPDVDAAAWPPSLLYRIERAPRPTLPGVVATTLTRLSPAVTGQWSSAVRATSSPFSRWAHESAVSSARAVLHERLRPLISIGGQLIHNSCVCVFRQSEHALSPVLLSYQSLVISSTSLPLMPLLSSSSCASLASLSGSVLAMVSVTFPSASQPNRSFVRLSSAALSAM